MVAKVVAQASVVLLAVFLAACGGRSSPAAAPDPATLAPAVTAPATPVNSTAETRASTTTPAPVNVATNTPDLHTPPTPACSREEVTRLVERFLDAFNRGDSAQLARFFGPRFEWYSVTDRGRESEDRHFLAYNSNGGLRLGAFPEGLKVTVGHQDILLPYFAERHAHGERLELRKLGSNYEAGRNIAHITYTLTRTAEDLELRLSKPERETLGKGAVDCTDQTLMVWSMVSQ